jgi:hypothetical protein
VVRHGGHLVVAGSTAGFNMFLTLKPRSEKTRYGHHEHLFFLGGAYGDLTKHGRLPEFWGCPVDGLFRYMAIRPRRWSILRAELLDMAVFFFHVLS